MQDFGKDWMTWVRYTITFLLITICVGVFILASQKSLTAAVQAVSMDRQAAVFTSRSHEVNALCRIGDYDWKYSTNKEISDVKDLDLSEVRVWKSGFIALEFSNGSIVVHSGDNCVVSTTPKYKTS